MELPPGMKTNVVQDPPLLQHIEVEFEGHRACTTIGLKDDPHKAIEALACIMLHVRSGTSPRKVVEGITEKAESEQRRKRRRARRLERKSRNKLGVTED